MEPLLRRTLGEHVQLQITTTDCSTEVVGDPTHLEQVILNLAVNARDAMPDGGVLWIATAIDFDDEAPQNDRVVLSVTDTGEGIPNEIRDRMFEPFVTTKETGQGNRSRALDGAVDRHRDARGHRRAHEDRRGHDVRDLARPSIGGCRPRPVSSRSRRRSTARGRRILLVEDEESVRFALARLLQRLDFVVTTAVDGSEALQIVEQQTFDLVLTDAVMPGMSGPELIEHLRDARPELRVILMSGYTPDEMQTGDGSTVPRLRKPFTLSDLTQGARARARSRT